MKTKIKRGVMLIALAIMSCLVFGLVACTKPEPSEPVLSGISITNKAELTAEWHAGDADRTIVVALSPESFTSDKTEITVTSSGEAVTVDTDDKFKLHAVADGKATVTVAAGDFTDSVEITVSRAVPPLGGIAINATQLAAEWYIGEADRTVTVTYDPASDYNASNTPATVTSSILPAVLPMPAMAGVTSPTMIIGMRKPRNWLNMALNVTNGLIHGSVITLPRATPRTMAMIMRGSSPNRIFFMCVRFCFKQYRQARSLYAGLPVYLRPSDGYGAVRPFVCRFLRLPDVQALSSFSLSAMSRPSCSHAAVVSALRLWQMSTGVPTGSKCRWCSFQSFILDTALLAHPWLPNHPR